MVTSHDCLSSSHPKTNFLQVNLEGDEDWRDRGRETSKTSSHFSEGCGFRPQSGRQVANNNNYKLSFV